MIAWQLKLVKVLALNVEPCEEDNMERVRMPWMAFPILDVVERLMLRKTWETCNGKLL